MRTHGRPIADFIVGVAPVKEIRGWTAILGERITAYNGQFAGMTLSSEDGSWLWKVTAADMASVTVTEDTSLADERIKDTDVETERYVKAREFGPGDRWCVPGSVHLLRHDSNYLVRSNSATRFVFPKGVPLLAPGPNGRSAAQRVSSTSEGRDVFDVGLDEPK
jgi:hypothetical protein